MTSTEMALQEKCSAYRAGIADEILHLTFNRPEAGKPLRRAKHPLAGSVAAPLGQQLALERAAIVECVGDPDCV